MVITAYRAKYRKKGETGWPSWTHISDPSNRTLNMPDLDPGATYEVQIQAISQNEGDSEENSEWSDIGEGTANHPAYWPDTESQLSTPRLIPSWNEVWLITPYGSTYGGCRRRL